MAIRHTTHDHILHQIHYRLRVLSIHEFEMFTVIAIHCYFKL